MAASKATIFSFAILATMAAFSPVAAQTGPATAPAITTQADPENILHLDLTTGGRVTIRLYPEVAPGHVERIKTLTRQGFYNGIIFHRVIPGFMAQTGDPTGTGRGESDLPNLKAEFNGTPHLRGVLSMAREPDDFDSGNSQFFICFMPRFDLDRGKYTVFGRVTAGMQFVDRIAEGEPPMQPDRILRASIDADHIAPPDFSKFAVAAPTPVDTPVSAEELGN